MSDDDLPIYPLRQGDKLSGEWVEWRVRNLCKSNWRTAAVANPEVGLFSLLLFAEAYQQDPAGTLPDDDANLAQLAGLGLGVARWRRLREAGALRGWEPCLVMAAEDGGPDRRRLMHPVVTEVAMKSWDYQKASREGAAEGARRKQMYRVRKQIPSGFRSDLVKSDSYIGALLDRLLAAKKKITQVNVAAEIESMSRDNVTHLHDFKGG